MQSRRQVETLDASARTAPALAVAAQDNGRPVKLLQNARCHDADDADVPLRPALDDNEILCAIKSRTEQSSQFVAHRALDVLAAAIALVQMAGQSTGFLRV